jgi:hypothetical protein
MRAIERWLSEAARRFGPPCVGVLATLLVCGAPLYAFARTEPHEPELRVLATDKQLSALLADGNARVLIINAQDRSVARAALGRLTRPWEPDITTLVAPSRDDAAPGLLEALERTLPSAVVVVGLPGADPTWAEVERICRERGIAYTIVADEAQLTTDTLSITMVAGATVTDSGALIAQRGDISVVIALGASRVAAHGQVLVSNSALSGASDSAVQLTSDPHAGATQRVVVDDIRPVRLTIESERLRVSGGARLDPRLPAPATPEGVTP